VDRGSPLMTPRRSSPFQRVCGEFEGVIGAVTQTTAEETGLASIPYSTGSKAVYVVDHAKTSDEKCQEFAWPCHRRGRA